MWQIFSMGSAFSAPPGPFLPHPPSPLLPSWEKGALGQGGRPSVSGSSISGQRYSAGRVVFLYRNNVR